MNLFYTCISWRVSAFLHVAYIIYLSKILVKEAKSLFLRGIQLHHLGVSRIYSDGFRLFHCSQIHSVIAVGSLYITNSIFLLHFQSYTWILCAQILHAQCVIKVLIFLHFISPERICEHQVTILLLLFSW